MLLYKRMAKKRSLIISEFENLKIVGGTEFYNCKPVKQRDIAEIKGEYVHRHVYYEIFIVGANPLEMLTENGKKTYSNNILIVPPTLGHNGFGSYDSVYTISVFKNDDKENDWLSKIKNDDITELDLTENVSLYLSKLAESDFQSSLGKIKCESLLKLILTEIFLILTKENPEEKKTDYAEENLYFGQIDQYVNTHYIGQKGSLRELADNMFLSVRQTSRLIKKLYGCTFPQIINQRRMQAATVLLKNSEYSISDIINVLEFETENYFYYMFKKHYGKSPLQYRKSTKKV